MMCSRYIVTALAFSLFALNAAAQTPVVRDHRPGASKPTPAPAPAQPVVRDHRGIQPAEPRQWLIRGPSLQTNVEYAIINLRRQKGDHESRLTYKKMPSAIKDSTGWGENDGVWIFKRDNGSAGPLTDDDYLALYNTKTKRYLQLTSDDGHFATWSDKPRYVWMVKNVKPGDGQQTFTLFSVEQRRFIGICETGIDPYGADDGELCTHETPRGWKP